MKKPKLSLGGGGLKGLFTQHIEKIVFGIAVLFVLAFVFLGYRLESKLDGKTPDKLQDLAATAVSNIERPTFEEVKKERMPREGQGGRYFARVDSDDPPDPEVYVLKPWDQPLGKPGSKREDPVVFAPTKLETTALTGPLCIRAEEGDKSLLADLINAPAPEIKENKEKKQRGRAGSGYYSGMSGGGMSGPSGSAMGSSPYGMYGGMSGASGGGMPGSSGPLAGGADVNRGDKKKKQLRGPERTYPENMVCGYRPAGGPGSMMGYPGSGMMSGGMMSGGMMSGGMMSGGMMSGGMKPGGMKPGGMKPGGMKPGGGVPGMGMSEMAGATSGMSGGGRTVAMGGPETFEGQPIARPASVIAVKAVVPYRKQADEYKRVLGEAIGFDPMRDQPRIVFFQAQRADVTGNPDQEPQESDWQLVMTPKTAETQAREQRWHGIMPEIADLNYVDPNATMPGPPFMLRHMEEALLHSEVPRGRVIPTFEAPTEDQEKDGEDKKKGESADGSDLPGGLPQPGGIAGSGFPGSGGMMSGYPGSQSGYPGMPWAVVTRDPWVVVTRDPWVVAIRACLVIRVRWAVVTPACDLDRVEGCPAWAWAWAWEGVVTRAACSLPPKSHSTSSFASLTWMSSPASPIVTACACSWRTPTIRTRIQPMVL